MSIITKNLAVCYLHYKQVDLGETVGGTKWTIEMDEKEIMSDQMGTKPDDLLTTGRIHKISTQLKDGTVEKLSMIDPSFKTTGMFLSIDFTGELFESAREKAGTLVVRDMNDATAGGALKFYLAYAKLTGEIAFGPDQQKVYGVEFYCFRDKTHNSFGYFNDPGSLGIGSIDGEV